MEKGANPCRGQHRPGSGDSVHATIAHAACAALGLAEGVEATAVIKASLVILGVPA
ncbi:MAG: hypothetical protein ACLFTD_07670 [Halochromatium sp.]